MLYILPIDLDLIDSFIIIIVVFWWLFREWSGESTPTVRSPSPESELSGYGSASSFGFRMPEKLQIVKPMEGSATLHHWQRLATPHMAGIFEERDGVQIKHEQPLNDSESSTYSLLDIEEDGK